ncbi:MAG: NnrS family protein, partial [Mariprofundaceae bacterium]|nr:NnrS family protein [Mariprofundaceae bacterium]
MITIKSSEAQQDSSGYALFHLGFRPFFLIASLFAVISMILWMVEVVFSVQVLPSSISPTFWHAHEMIYGYVLAIIAGFLLTAVRNWTNIQTLH